MTTHATATDTATPHVPTLQSELKIPSGSNKALSSYWRVEKRATKAADMMQALNAFRACAHAVGFKDVNTISWGKQSYTQEGTRDIVLDGSPIGNGPSLPSDEAYDVVLGMLYHEVEHNLSDSDKVFRDFERLRGLDNKAADHEFFNILEDWYVDRSMAKRNALAGSYIKAARTAYNDPQSSKKLAEVFGGAGNYDLKYILKQTLLSIAVYGNEPVPGIPQPVLDFCNRVTSTSIKTLEPTATRGAWVADIYEEFVQLSEDEDLGSGKGTSGSDSNESSNESSGTPSQSTSSSEETSQASQPSPTHPSEGTPASSQAPEGQSGSAVSKSGTPQLPKLSLLEENKTQIAPELVKVLDEIDRKELDDITGEVQNIASRAGITLNEIVHVSLNTQEDAGKDPDAVRAAGGEYQKKIMRLLDEIKTSNTRYYRGEESGRISRTRLYRAPYNQAIFERKDKGDGSGLGIVLLLDNSASVDYNWDRIFAPIGVAVGAIRGKHEVTVLAYTAGRTPGITSISDSYTKVDVMYRRGFSKVHLGVSPSRGTPTGPALLAALSFAKKMRKPKRLILHVTDGLPDMPQKLVKVAQEEIARCGVAECTLLVKGNVSAEECRTMTGCYPEGVIVHSMEGVPDAIQAAIRKSFLR